MTSFAFMPFIKSQTPLVLPSQPPTHGTCSKYICISIDEDGNVQDAQFIGGCDGNTKGVCALIKGMKAKEVIARLKGITCGNKPTSCPDQLATALQEMGY
jgi:uncharacterized protein (TIGR03905 family)